MREAAPSPISRRLTIAGGAASLMLFTARKTFAAGSLCAMTKMNPEGSRGLYKGSRAAQKDLADVMAALDIQLEIPIFASEQVQNAAAFPNLNGGPAIIYNPDFLTDLYSINDWAPASVIAHEFGHHVARRRSDPNSHVREIAADEVSGCAMAWMQATEDEATVAMTRGLPVTAGSQSHPGTAARIEAIRRAYRECQQRSGRTSNT